MLSTTPQPFTTDANGEVQVTYTAPATLPTTGTDTLAAASAASQASISATDTYDFTQAVGGGGGAYFTTAPTVSGINPSSGPTAGGTTVTITGSGFTGAGAVDFGLTPAESVTVDSATQITAVSPAGTAGATVDVTVTAASGTSTTTAADRFTYQAAAGPSTVRFPDVPSTYWAYADVETLAGKGIVNGFPDGTFRPDAAVTRAQFVKMMDLTLGMAPGTGVTPFADVSPAAWFAPYVSAAVRAEIVDGVSPTMFDPNGTLTREQMAVLLARALRLTKSATLHFTDDATIEGWALKGVEEAVAAGYIAGFPDGSLQPLGTTTRAQAARVLAMVLRNTGS